MKSNTYNKVIEDQIDICKDTLINKAKEYATDDLLHNFKTAAVVMGCDPKEALAGMMVKHTISIYDMCRDGKEHDINQWIEKITDHINYLLILKAIVVEELPDKEDESHKYQIATRLFTPVVDNLKEKSVDIPPVKPDLAARILDFSDQIERCAKADCELCPYSDGLKPMIPCEKAFKDDFNSLITDLLNAERKPDAN